MSSNEKQILFDYSVESCTPFVPIQNHLITRNSFCAVPFKLVFMFHHTEKVWVELYHYIVWLAKNEGNVSFMYFLAFHNFICHLDLFQLLFISKVQEIWLVVASYLFIRYLFIRNSIQYLSFRLKSAWNIAHLTKRLAK